ncbi:MAG: Agmatine deiminase (EC [uncultured Paraburkholderia sp.]|nr:MAG: Agmatine deiminase (EC [uncultured Paraburkholderia sp.]CAH2945104.1 MAG: Agmatine deiminase (EC [uncultured Paraburkholderia sp.]
MSLGMTVPPSVSASSNRSKAGKFFQPFAKDHTVAAWMAKANNATLIQRKRSNIDVYPTAL